jgi:hypothetical protein
MSELPNGYLLQLLEDKDIQKTFVSRLNFIREESKNLLSTINIVFPQYTPHTIEHKDKILEVYSKIFPESLLKALNKYELFFLIAATYLHDIGMAQLSKLGDIENEIDIAKKQQQLIRERII